MSILRDSLASGPGTLSSTKLNFLQTGFTGSVVLILMAGGLVWRYVHAGQCDPVFAAALATQFVTLVSMTTRAQNEKAREETKAHIATVEAQTDAPAP